MNWGYNIVMLDIQFIRDNPDKIKKAAKDKGLKPEIVEKVLELDKQWRELLSQEEGLEAEKNKITSKFEDKEIRATDGKFPKKFQEDYKRAFAIKQKIKDLKTQRRKAEVDRKEMWDRIPNLPAKDVKTGKNEKENEEIKKWGEIKKIDFSAKDHMELGKKLDLIDVKRATKVSGARFGYLKNEAVLLEFALVNFALEILTKKEFIPIIPPVLIKKQTMQGMGYLEHGGEDEMYVLEKDGLVLVGTSEQSIGSMHMNEVFNAKDLPRRYVGFSTCFRREAGSYGKDTKGILRVHQFDKVEMFSFTKPEDGDKEHEFMLSMEEKLFKALKIPYRVVKMCTGDLGAPAARKYDLEAWLPGQEKYREVTSTSTTTDFQSRRLNIKYRTGNKTDYVHMLNGTAFAIGRTIIAIMENYQQKDGSVKIPEVLQKYVGKKVITVDK